MKKAILGILVLGIIWGLALAEDVVEKGKPAPNFTLEDLSGNKVSLSDFKGKVVLLNFWALFCGPCREEMPSMERLYQEFKNDGLVVVAVNWGDDKKAVEKFVKENNLTFIVLPDSERETGKKYPSRYIPYSIIIDRDGIVRDIIIGARNWDSNTEKSRFKKMLEGDKQEQASEFKLISPKELVKELKDPDSKRLKAWGYLSGLEIASTPVDSWMNLLAENEKFMLKFIVLMNDPGVANYLSARAQEENGLYEKMLYQNFEYDEFAQTFSKALDIFKKIVIIIQESLDLSQEEQQKAFKESAEFIKKLDNPDLLVQQPSNRPHFPQYSDHFKLHCAFNFIRQWAEQSVISLDENLVREIVDAALAIEHYVADDTVDRNSDEFKEKFAEYQKDLQDKFNRLIKFIKTLPEK